MPRGALERQFAVLFSGMAMKIIYVAFVVADDDDSYDDDTQ